MDLQSREYFQQRVRELAMIVIKIMREAPGTIGAEVSHQDIRSMVTCIETDRWHTILCRFGLPFMEQLQAHFESVENYEFCAAIKKTIEWHTNVFLPQHEAYEKDHPQPFRLIRRD